MNKLPWEIGCVMNGRRAAQAHPYILSTFVMLLHCTGRVPLMLLSKAWLQGKKAVNMGRSDMPHRAHIMRGLSAKWHGSNIAGMDIQLNEIRPRAPLHWQRPLQLVPVENPAEFWTGGYEETKNHCLAAQHGHQTQPEAQHERMIAEHAVHGYKLTSFGGC